MAAEQNLGPLAQIPPGEGRNFAVSGVTIAVFRTQADEVFATQPRCPHRAGPLADGMLGGTNLMCPLHDFTFDLRTGAGVGNDTAIATYPARLAEDGSIRVTL